MPTVNQLVKRKRAKPKTKRKAPALVKCPQKAGTVLRLDVRNPKKPNSADRKVAKTRLSTGQSVNVYVPGENMAIHVQEHTNILIRGGGPPDLPGVKYTLIPNGKKLVPGADGQVTAGTRKDTRQNARSKYGVKKP
jgi:small subunit ribosomal protein S12